MYLYNFLFSYMCVCIFIFINDMLFDRNIQTFRPSNSNSYYKLNLFTSSQHRRKLSFEYILSFL